MISKFRLINFVSVLTLLLPLFLHESIAAFDKISPKMKRASRHTYHISVDYKQNWYRANHYCKYYNMDLVTVEDAMELGKIKTAIDSFNYGNKTFWTAATDLGSLNGELYWATTGTTVDKTQIRKVLYTNVTGVGSPPGLSFGAAAVPQTTVKNCLALKRMEYVRENCMSENYFICQSYEIVNEIGRRLIFS